MSLNTVTAPDFGVIDIDPVVVGQVLEAFVHRGSKLTGVSLDDIDLRVKQLPPNNTIPSLEFLLNNGMKLFDAIVWLSARNTTSHPLVADATITDDSILSMHTVARAVFYTYFFLLTQARYPAVQTELARPKVANFLTNIMGMSLEQHIYIEQLCSFTPQKFDPVWIRNVSFAGFGQESLSRFGLGVAGYRSFGPFKLYEPVNPVPPELLHAYNFAKTVAESPPTWDIHPLTRDPAVLTKRGNLNKNLGNLMLKIYTPEELADMAASKVLFRVPTEERAHRNFLTWGPTDDISGTHPIFRTNRT